jgi:hypothetical protein
MATMQIDFVITFLPYGLLIFKFSGIRLQARARCETPPGRILLRAVSDAGGSPHSEGPKLQKTSKNPSEMLDLLKTLPLECDI